MSRQTKFVMIGLITLMCVGGLVVTTIGAGLFLGTNLSRGRQIASTLPPIPTPQPYNQIAYIGNDDNVWLISPDGSKKRQLTSNSQMYRMPTWSPDNQQLAFSGLESTQPVVYLSPVDHSDPNVVFRDAAEPPIYLYWSPDSQTLTFITQSPGDFTLHAIEVFPPYNNQVLGRGSPYFWAWSPRGNRILTNMSQGTKKAQLALLSPNMGQEATPFKVNTGKFQTPLWAKDGEHIFYVVADGKRRGILYQAKINANDELSEQVIMARLKGPTFMVQSPDGEHIFYMQLQRRNEPPFGTAYMLDVKSGASRLLTEMPIASAYWSPDGKKLALLTLGHGLDKGETAKVMGHASPLSQEAFHQWWVYSLDTGKMDVLKTFNPTDEFKQTIPFFDQYALSQTYWSPDSRYFLIAEKDAKNPVYGTIWVADTTFEQNITKLTEGKIAVWSWR